MGYVHTIDPVAATVLGFKVYWYGLAYTFGFTVLVLWLAGSRRTLGWRSDHVVDSSLIFVVCALAGGRIFDVVVYEWEWYRVHPAEVAMLWKGGMASHGIFIGAVAAAAIAAARTGTPVLRLLDSLTVPAAFIFGVGRIGNFIEGGVIGTPTSLPWGVKLPDVEGFRHPVALYDGGKNLALVPLLLVVLRRWPAGSGVASGVFLLGYGGLRFLVDQFRDYESVLLGLGPGQWFNLAMAAAGLGLVVVCLRQPFGCVPTTTAAATGRRRALLRARVALLVLLVAFPLSIPTSWTTEYLRLKRHGRDQAAVGDPGGTLATYERIAPERGAAQSRLESRATQSAIPVRMSGGIAADLRERRSTNVVTHSKVAASAPRVSLTMNIT
ncbi:MAG: prolipoprotein diacylglyceryl transferase [Acidobacteria bacterium]|nr:MAG: prolipoprotein diacylglyceryl transferase [Acidobacteriota bacterium]